MTDASMDWLLDSLKTLREVRDWAAARRRRDARAATTRTALEAAARDFEALAVSRGLEIPPAQTRDALARIELVPPRARLVEPLGPAKVSASVEPSTSEAATTPPAFAADPRIDLDSIDPQAIAAIRRLRRYGYKGYLVGGCVRDLLLGIQPKDFDIATDARPEEVKAVFRNSRIIGRRFRLVHLYYRGGKVLEVATFRAAVLPDDEEEANGDLLIRRDNVYGTEQEDARRRDFTINALFFDPESRKIIDHVGGLADIDARVVRMIGDPDIRLREDPVRIVRAIRFRAKANLTIEPSLEAALGRHVEELVRCAPARLLEETLKLLRMGYALTSFDLMLEHGVVDVLLPEIQAFLTGRFGLLAGTSTMEGRDPLAEVRAHLGALDEVVSRTPVPDDVVLGALLYPMADAAMTHADETGRDRNKLLAELLGEVGVRIQITRRLSEQLRQAYAVQRHFQSEPGQTGRRRRRVSAATLIRRAFFPSALRLFEVHQRAVGGDLGEIASWEARAREEGVLMEGSSRPRSGDRADGRAEGRSEGRASGREDASAKRRRRRGGKKRRRPSSAQG